MARRMLVQTAMTSLPSIDSGVLDDITGGLGLGVCRDLSQMSKKVRRAGMEGLGDAFGSLSSDCRAEWRAQHPGVINAVKSWF